MRTFKKATAILLAVVMLLSMTTGGNVANASTTEEESTSPVASVVFEPLEIIEHEQGYYCNQDTEDEWFCYNYWMNRVKYTLTMQDGSVIEGTGAGFDYNGEWRSFGFSDNQSMEHWTVGNTYYVTIDALGCTGEIAVT